MPQRIFSCQTYVFKEIQRYLTTMYGNQLVELALFDNYSWKILSLNFIGEVVGLQQKEFMHENCQGNKYFLINLDIRSRE